MTDLVLAMESIGASCKLQNILCMWLLELEGPALVIEKKLIELEHKNRIYVTNAEHKEELFEHEK